MAESSRVPVTMSVGVAHTQNAPDTTVAEMLVEAADVALYAAKRGGRNRVEVANPGRYTAGVVASPAPKAPGSAVTSTSTAAVTTSTSDKPRRRAWDKPTADISVSGRPKPPTDR
jgi:hypothetical protein